MAINYDFNGDGKIDIKDIGTVVHVYNTIVKFPDGQNEAVGKAFVELLSAMVKQIYPNVPDTPLTD